MHDLSFFLMHQFSNDVLLFFKFILSLGSSILIILRIDIIYHMGSLQNDAVTGDGSVDIKGRPVLKNSTGKWKACPFILGTYFSVSNYLFYFCY